MSSDRSGRIPVGKIAAGEDSADAIGDKAGRMASDVADDPLAAAAKRAHARSLEQLSPRVRAQLALRRRDALAPARRDRRARWWPALTATSVAAMALAIGLRLQPPPQPSSADVAEDLAAIVAEMDASAAREATNGTTGGAGRGADRRTNAVAGDAVGVDSPDEYTLDESPDLYLWLASDEADVLTEETP